MSALAAGAISQVSVGGSVAKLLSAAATGGTSPYTYQWYRSTTSGFTPGAGTLIAGATALTLSDSGLTPSTVYYYKVIATDSVAATSTATQLAVTTTAPQLSQNSFGQQNILGKADLLGNVDTISVQVDSTQATALLAGQAVKSVNSAGGIPKVIACAANSDECIGFINYDVKSQSFAAGDRCEISMAGNVIYLYSTTAIARFAQVTLDIISVGGVASSNSGDKIVGYALDKATAAGTLIRVKLKTPSFTTA